MPNEISVSFFFLLVAAEVHLELRHPVGKNLSLSLLHGRFNVTFVPV